MALQDSRLQFLMEQREKKRETVDQYLKDWDKKNGIINKEVESAMNERKKCEAQIKELQEKVNILCIIDSLLLNCTSNN